MSRITKDFVVAVVVALAIVGSLLGLVVATASTQPPICLNQDAQICADL